MSKPSDQYLSPRPADQINLLKLKSRLLHSLSLLITDRAFARKSITGFLILLLFAGLILPLATPAQSLIDATAKSQPVIWIDPGDIANRDLFHGSGGEGRQPKGSLTFIEEDSGGSKPKFLVQDENGIRWKIKLGAEAQPETAATRLLWAAGYFTDETYYREEVRIENMKSLKRGSEFVSADGTVRGARIERDEKGDKKKGEWSWFDNPFTGTRQLNGLRIMMALINNWDLKKENNAIRERQGFERAYYVSDLGSSFGQTGNSSTRSRNNLNDYLESEFISEVESDRVDFVLKSRPPFYLAVLVPYYLDRARMEKIGNDIPRDDARWLGNLLGQLSDKQISDAFRAAGYTAEEITAYANKVRERIEKLKNL